MSSFTRLLILLMSALTYGCPMAMALADKENEGRWKSPTTIGPDKVVPGFLVNLGPTGARAVLTEKSFVVQYIFDGSPAVDRLMLGDEILGVFGKPFSSTFFNGIFGAHHGYEGPMMELGEAIEKAEGSDGKLILNVSRRAKQIEVKIDLEAIGSFSPTFPMNCKKSELLRTRALKYLVDHQTPGQAHERSAMTLALLTSGDPKQQAVGKQMALAWNGQNPTPETWTWDLSYQLITLSEYHLLTEDASVLPMITTLVQFLNKAQYSGKITLLLEEEPELYKKFPKDVVEAANQILDGGFSHSPYHPIVYVPPTGKANRDGPNHYGPMVYPTNIAVTAWQLAARCGATLNQDNLNRAMLFIHRATSAIGAVNYGMQFFFDPNGKIGIDATKAYQASTDESQFIGRTGSAFVAHKLSPEFPDTPSYLAKYSSFLKGNFKKLPDGHAEANMDLFWTLMADASAENETALRATLDYHKAFFNMMRCFDGSFVLLPSRSGSHDMGYYMCPRLHPTATMALTYGMNNPKLRLQGVSVSIAGIIPKALKGPLQVAYKCIEEKSYADSIKLIRPVRSGKKASADETATCDALLGYIESQFAKRLDHLQSLEKKTDFLGLQASLAQTQSIFGQLDSFKEKIKYFDDGLKSSSWKEAIKTGTNYARIIATLKRSRSKTSVRELEDFAEKNPDSLYGKWALVVLEEYRAHGVVTDPSTG